ncbi:hypothetical protein HDIA_4066 [Hartmannibacter diazotrophicus]|uniref:Putative DNA-binding domain-containing protein n=1 Tax=Hartmannibacter diazotrophicus TaxID=1482074 RepID=A0A2C9DBD4_9HYPH|nr:DNA-binding domain-containing protein [Hartmannibacter diazotrophicus]SON57607.1 hypothetical protein HDIA_4066 [Hartmannibacter diazotrophicus]
MPLRPEPAQTLTVLPGRGDHAAIEAAFAAALTDPGAPVPDGLCAHHGGRIERRFAVYRNNVVASLCEALGDLFPATQRIVGQEFFRMTARAYLAAEAPSDPRLNVWGGSFPLFLETFAPVAGLPYLADVARHDRAYVECYHAADALPLAPQALSAVAPDDLGRVRLTLHPAARIVRSRHAAHTIWQFSRRTDPEGDLVVPEGGEDTLFVRPDMTVTSATLPPGGAAFLLAIDAGETLEAAADTGLADSAGFDLGTVLAVALSTGAFASDVALAPA